jgi:hypothetical protein
MTVQLGRHVELGVKARLEEGRGKRKGEEERRKKLEEESVCAHVEPGPDR